MLGGTSGYLAWSMTATPADRRTSSPLNPSFWQVSLGAIGLAQVWNFIEFSSVFTSRRAAMFHFRCVVH